MSSNLYKGVVKLSKEQFSELKENGTITIDSVVYTYSPKDTTYVVEDNTTEQVTQNTNDISQLKTDVSTLNETASSLQFSVQTNTSDITNLKADKLDKNQGVANAGKVMLVGDDGNITPQTLSEGGTTVLVDGQPQTTWNADLKADKASLASVATSGSYNDLTGKPTIPTDNSQLTNGAGYATTSQIPTNNYQLANGAGYVTQTEVNSAVANKTAVNVGGTLQPNLNFDSDPQTQLNNLLNALNLKFDKSGGIIGGDTNIQGELQANSGKISGNDILTTLQQSEQSLNTDYNDLSFAVKLSNGIIVNVFTILSADKYNFLLPYTYGYNYATSYEYNGGNFRGDRLYLSTADLTGVAIAAYAGPVHMIVIGK